MAEQKKPLPAYGHVLMLNNYGTHFNVIAKSESDASCLPTGRQTLKSCTLMRRLHSAFKLVINDTYL